MDDSTATFSIRPPAAKDRARWESMFVDLAGNGPEPCSRDAPAYVWQCAMAPEPRMELLIAADRRDDAVGFALYHTHPYSWSRRPVTYLLDLYVHPSARGAGVGTALIEKLAEKGRAAGWLKIYWMTQADNAAAHALYGKLATRSALVRYDLHLNGYELADAQS